jgi:acetoin utilization protein AcuB
MKAMQAMTRNVVCIREEDTLQTAHDLMQEWEIRHLPVTNERKLVGIITDRDILPYVSYPGHQELGFRLVADAMTRQVLTVSPADPVSHIANVMSLYKIDCLPVVEDDGSEQLVGLITSMDLVDLLREKEILDVSRSVPWTYTVRGSENEPTAFV